MILADLPTPTPNQFAAWMVCAASAIIMANQSIRFYRSLKGEPARPPNEILGASQAEIIRRVEVTEQTLADFRSAAKKDRSDLYDKINEIRKELTAKIETSETNFGTRFDELPERLINLLRNTGAIGKSR